MRLMWSKFSAVWKVLRKVQKSKKLLNLATKGLHLVESETAASIGARFPGVPVAIALLHYG